jgi:uncharacterized protein YceH (UPF0502 family)
MSVAHSLTSSELRVLACLVEKSYTTPDQYPLSTNALTTACNQKTSREPVVTYSTQHVDQTLQLLRDAGWVRMIRASGSRAFKHRHVIDEKLELTTPQQAVLAVLALRGAQSPGELKTRTDRYHAFEDLDAVERVLADLSNRDVPLTRNVGREPGQSQDRWVQLLGPAEDLSPGAGAGAGAPSAVTEPAAAAPPIAAPFTAPPAASPTAPAVALDVAVSDGAPSARSSQPDTAELEARVSALEARLQVLEQELGLDQTD